MKLITKEIERKAPRLRATANKKPEDVEVIAKFFNPVGSGTWYMTEYDPKTGDAFGWVDLGFHDGELGYFNVRELENVKLKWGLSIERDLYYTGHTLADAMGR